MKKIYPLSIALLISSAIYAQTPREKRIIKNSYNTEKIENYSKILREKENKNKREIAKLIENGTPKEILLDNGKIAILKSITAKGEPIYITTDNVDAAESTRTNFLHTGGLLGLDLNGENMTIGVWDGETILSTHVEFQRNGVSRISTPDGAQSGYHATHVGGTIGAQGIDPDAKGMAPEAEILSYDWNSDNIEVIQAAANGLLISNHSYGTPVSNSPAWFMGAYSSESRQWDVVANSTPYYLQVLSAGNDGSETYSGGLMNGFDKLTGNKVSKNNLVVANSNDVIVNPTNGSVLLEPNMNASSSQGPADDGRIKPDITGNGTNVYSSSNTSDTAYGNSTGTSMSSPNVAGSLLLLQQYYNQLNSNFMLSATLKGLACHTATDIGNVGPDARSGWGLLDTKKAAETITGAFDSNPQTAIINELSLSNGNTYTITVNSNEIENLEATICWTDQPGQATTQSNDPAPALVNDLDIRIIQGGTDYLPWRLDLSNVAAPAVKGDNNVDNVEKVEVENPNSSIYTIEVTHKGSLSGGAQNFSLIVTGITATSMSVANNEMNSEINVWPNPANNFINITSEKSDISDYNINLYDLQGRVVMKDISSETVNISSLSKGLYILDFRNGNQSFQKKIIKE
ncbi:S8 family serine peptidase [Mesonia mobilis]|uniref:S8 family serine peptidase n=1 Tax=Mesonia mobilis TaxID=369791 RepID=UPI0026ED9CE0|nr:S8 family serine peptidase [Mesonia mobilis]